MILLPPLRVMENHPRGELIVVCACGTFRFSKDWISYREYEFKKKGNFLVQKVVISHIR